MRIVDEAQNIKSIDGYGIDGYSVAADWTTFDQDRGQKGKAAAPQKEGGFQGGKETTSTLAQMDRNGYVAAKLPNGNMQYSHPNGTTLIRDRNSGHWHGLSADGAHLDTTKMPYEKDPDKYANYAAGFARVAAVRDR